MYCMVCGAVVLALAPVAWAEVYVQNDRMYVGNDGSLHIVGEVQNDLDMTIGQIHLDATIYDAQGQIMHNAQGWSLINTLVPGMRGPFDILMTGPGLAGSQSYSIDVEYAVLVPKSQVIDVVSASVDRNSQGNTFITGTVVNRGEITANMISVVATIYDRDGKVATVSKTRMEPDYLRAGSQGAFVIPLQEKDQISILTNYHLVAESDEYAAVPEFPLGSLAVLLASSAAYVVATRVWLLKQRIISNQSAAAIPLPGISR